MKQTSGRIAYLNTSGFAIRRSFVEETDFFPVNIIRGEDTCVLTKLICKNDPPVFVSDAIVKHSPKYSLINYLIKHIHIGYHSCCARLLLAEKTDTIMNFQDKMKMLGEMKNAAAKSQVPYFYLIFIFMAYLFECCGRLAFHLFGVKSDKLSVLSIDIEPLREAQLISKAFLQVERKNSFIITYLTAWSLVQSKTNRIFKKLLNECDLIYADGMGVVLAAILTELRLLKKVTLNDFYEMLFEEISNQNYTVAFIGAKPGIARAVADYFQKKYRLRVLLSESGYFNKEEKSKIISELVQSQPDIVFLGMGQPIQEEFASSIRQYLPHTVLWCVGDLFNTIVGVSPKPPRFIRKIGLEWLHRLIHDPARLWRRYVFGLPQLAYYILNEIFGKFSRSLARVFRVDLDY